MGGPRLSYPRAVKRLALVAVLLASLAAFLPAASGHVGTPTALKATAVDAGFVHTCAVTLDGGVRCWGTNGRGQLGDGTTLDRVVPVGVRNLDGIRAVVAGDHTCALTDRGAVACWGRNSSGELGDGTKRDRKLPVAVPGLSGHAVAIAVGLHHTCVLNASETVECWGDNARGQLGSGTTADSSTPVAVARLAGVVAVAAGGSHTCALTEAGAVKCWGSNVHGQLGIGSEGGSSLVPVDVAGLSAPARAIAVGAEHSCAVTGEDSAPECWGIDSHGQLGTVLHCGTFPDWVCPSPVAVDRLSNGVSAMDGGPDHTCARTDAGALKCWGEGSRGQLGNGGGYSYVPVDVVGFGGGAAAVTVGGFHTCALTSAAQVKCWGDNANGQVGDATRRNRSTPVAVVAGPSVCIAPRLRGKTLAAAKRAFGRTACSLSLRRAYSNTVPKGRVVSQRPAAGVQRPAGAAVSVVLSKGKRS